LPRQATDENEYSDLLWAARGAGQGFFGVVTCFEYRLDVLPRGITLMQSVFPLDSAPQVVQYWYDKKAELPSHMEVVTLLATGEPRDLNRGSLLMQGLEKEKKRKKKAGEICAVLLP
jgi:FAD/FMN-containing dehydrogenase